MVIVTGAAGFIGSAFIWKLNAEGVEDIITVDSLGNDERWKNLRQKVYRDYIDKDDFIKLIQDNKFNKVKAVYHIGACSSTTETDAAYIINNNFEYSKSLALWCFKNNVRFVYASSAATYGAGENGYSDDHDGIFKLKPLNVYGYSKQLFDMWILKNGFVNKAIGLKYFNVFGPNEYHKKDMMSVICKAYTQIKETGKLKLFKSHKDGITDGEQKRDFVYIKDVINVMYFFLQNNVSGIFNVGTGKARSFNDLAKSTFNAMEKSLNIEYIPTPESIRKKYQYFTQAEMDKLKQEGYNDKFTELEDAVSDYVKNYLINENYL